MSPRSQTKSRAAQAAFALAALLALVALLAGASSASALNRTATLASTSTGVADPGTANAYLPGASRDGRRVFVETAQRLTADDNDAGHVDVYERTGDTTTLISKPTGVADPGNDDASFNSVSRDGSRVFFATTQKLTADDADAGLVDVYVRAGGTTTLVSKPTGVADPGTAAVTLAGTSPDGTRAYFHTRQKMTADDNDTSREDVYERTGATTTLVSKATGVPDPDNANADFRGISRDGTHVVFETIEKMTAEDLDAGLIDVYDRTGGVTRLVSRPAGTPDPNTFDASFGAISADGARITFDTRQKLTADDLDANRNDAYQRAA